MDAVPEQAHYDRYPERSAAVVDALRALPPRMGTVVVLRHHEDLTEARTAELLGCSLGTVQTRVGCCASTSSTGTLSEWAVFGGTPDEVVDRAGRSALD